MKKLQKISSNELNYILQQHELWITSNGKTGKQANLSQKDLANMNFQNLNLRGLTTAQIIRKSNKFGSEIDWRSTTDTLDGADFSESNLQNTNFQDANLQFVNFRGANLRGADLRGANLLGTNLLGADLQGAKYHPLEIQRAKISFIGQIQAHKDFIELNQEIQEETLLGNYSKVQELESQLHELLNQQDKLQNELSIANDRIINLEQELSDRIDLAKTALENSLKTAKKYMENNENLAKKVSHYSFISLVILSIMLIIIPFLFVFIKVGNDSIISKVGNLSILLYTTPVIITLSISITLLRHHKKLQDEIRHYSDQIQRVELFSSLLEAAQYASITFKKNNQDAEKLVENTFIAIRDKLLLDELSQKSSGNIIIDEPHNNSIIDTLRIPIK